MLKFGERERERERNSKRTFYAVKKPIKIWNGNVDNIVISELVKTKTNSKSLIGIKLDKYRTISFDHP